MLLASFLGMSVGCLAARRPRAYLGWTPTLLAIAMGTAHLVEFVRQRTGAVIDVGNQASPQLVFFGVEYQPQDPAGFVVPIEVVGGFFFLVIALTFIGHQQMISRETPSQAYVLPHLLNRDTGGTPFGDVLIIGAGSGNDVSRALAWGARRVDAVEIDPVIHRLGLRDHPDHPYSDPRVTVHLDDGRNFLRSTDRQYDLIVYALVDSLVLHSSYSNIRLESYLFTTQAFRDARRCLKPGGLFAMYNYFRHGWLVARLVGELEQSFGSSNPIVFGLPPREVIRPEDTLFGEFTLILAGRTQPFREAFADGADYWLQTSRVVDERTPNGFRTPAAAERATWFALGNSEKQASGWQQFRPAGLVRPRPALRPATDDWPFLYLRRRMIPAISLRGMAIMAGVALLLLIPFVRSRRGPMEPRPIPDGSGLRMFFLGAGFMLLETKAVVQMALLFGGTWVVNSIVFLAVLVMILGANLFVARARPANLGVYYVALVGSLALSAVIPLEVFLGLSRPFQILASSLITFVPILFAGVIFAVSFARTGEPDRAFGANIAGAMAGGLAEYSSMLVGFQRLVLVAIIFYALSAPGHSRAQSEKVRSGL